jgi:hypothetical protein
MAFWDRFARTKDNHIPTGRKAVADVNFGPKTLSPYRSRTTQVLSNLRRHTDKAGAIKYLREENADVSMSVWNFIRMANQGHEMHFYGSRGGRLTEIEKQWTEFAARVNEISNAGLDGLIDQFHQSAFMLGAQGAEAEVTEKRDDIAEVYPIDPQYIYWEYLTRNGRSLWVPYQHQQGKKVYLDKTNANFFWVPTDPMIDDPRGTLILSPVIQAIDFQMQILQDLQAVLHHQGWPRNDIKILLERTMQAMPADIRARPAKQREWLKESWDEIISAFKNLEPDSDYIHYDDIEINLNQGANAGRSLDVRAITELVDTQTLSGSKQMAIFMNRNQGITESWGTVQFKIFCSGIMSVQRGSKRLVEEIARLWLRVKGIQATPHFKHNTIDWESEEQRTKVNLLKQQYYAIAVLMGWLDNDQAAAEMMNVAKAKGPPSENIRVSLSSGGGEVIGNGKHQGEKRQPDQPDDDDD